MVSWGYEFEKRIYPMRAIRKSNGKEASDLIDQLDGRALLSFLAVMEERNFSRAADKLGYVQSTITAHIAQLEKASGAKLFDRLPRGVEPTEAGIALARFAERFAALSRALEDELRQTESPSGVLRVRALESYCVARLPRALAAYAERYREVELQLSTGFMADICERVLDQREELGIVPRDPMRNGLTFVPLPPEELVWVTAPHRELTERSAYIGYGPSCLYHGIGEQILRQAGYASLANRSYPSVELIKRMVQSGYGISLLPKVNVAEELRNGTLARLDLPSPDALPHGFIHVRDKRLRPAASAFVELVRSSLGQ